MLTARLRYVQGMASEGLPLRVQLLRRVNPVIACVLQSRLHRLGSGHLLVLQYRGRTSAKQYSIPLAYVMHAEHVYCATRDTQWWRSAVAAESVTIWLRGQPVSARAERGSADALDTRMAFSKFLADNPGTAKLLYGVRIDARGEPDAGDIDREIHRSNVIRFTTLPPANLRAS